MRPLIRMFIDELKLRLSDHVSSDVTVKGVKGYIWTVDDNQD